MMKKRDLLIVLFMLLGSGAVLAMLPPDASFREPQLRRERIEVNRKYEKYIVEQREIAIQRYNDVTAGLDYPPWKRAPSGAPLPDATLSSRTKVRDEKAGHSWLIGLSGLLVIGGLFCLIKQMTREADNR